MGKFQPLKVAVFGSCVTRDNFNRTFNPGYKDLFECAVLTDHVSMVSVMGAPIDVDPATLNGLEPRIFNNLQREFARSFLKDLEDSQPDYLVMDFWPDLIFGFARLDTGGLITNNAWSTMKTDFYKTHSPEEYRIHLRKDDFMREWTKAIDAFFEALANRCPNTKVIVHSARNVASWKDSKGEVHEFGPWPLAMNKHWDDLDAYVLGKHASRKIQIDIPGLQSFEGHPWGRFPVHYTFDYHAQFLAKMTRIVFDDLSAVVAERDSGRRFIRLRRSFGSRKPVRA